MFRRLLDSGGELWWQEDLERARVESGYPLWGVDFDDSHLPQEIRRDELAISFTKGCYLGQETIARLDALGHVNRHLAGVRFEGDKPPPVGTKLSDPTGEQIVGATRSCVWSVRLNGPLALAVLRVGYGEVGQPLQSDIAPGQVVNLPL